MSQIDASMKQLFLLALLVCGMQAAIHAQPAVTGSRLNSTSSYQAKKNVVRLSNMQRAALNNRKIYHWKNGQRATPTGHEATGSNTDAYVSQRKDSVAQTSGVKH